MALNKADALMDVAIRRSFLIPSSEIYGSPSGFFDYGPVGAAIKRKIENLWRSEFLHKEGFHEIETSLIVPEAVLKASGHAENFADPLVTCSQCKNKFRADHLIEQSENAKKEHVKAAGLPPAQLGELIQKYAVLCPQCKKPTLSDVGWFNMMFRTNIGPIEGNTAYFRPETAQGIFLDFARIVRNYQSKLPIGIGQVGRSARNEISPRQGLIRMREFTQMELEYFFNPKDQSHPKFGKIKHEKLRFASEEGQPQYIEIEKAVHTGLVANEIMAYFLWKVERLYLSCGIPKEKFHFRKMPKEETPHYSKGNIDLEVETSYGLVETVGVAYRTDFDLSSHSKHSGADLSVFVEGEKAKVVPHVVEPSMGVDRLFWCVLEHAFRGKTPEKDWEWFDFPPAIAPYHAWIFPLMKKDGMDEKARQIEENLREEGLTVYYQDSGSIGRRYARADEIGVPYCITVDYDTLDEKSDKHGTVTVRFRNDGKQIRVKIGELSSKIAHFVKEGKVRDD
ncbi:TPA: glycine--tRNA ligase [Candidatus Micrarchaeota archaeon]|nr:glycine--tRNA ligase [Candidatus Micrarchaeota archaeon]HIH30143.1 glycine--tRNA ligase [Candidatus Micrarchaeota archaeon]